jgi:hypothetical protein
MARRIDDNPNERRQPRLDLLSVKGRELLQQDPDLLLEETRVVVEELAAWDSETRLATLDAAAHRDIVEEALERFKQVDELETHQRQREVDDLKFDRGLLLDQWSEKDVNARTALGRPCLVVSRLDAPITQVENEFKDSRLAVHVRPRGKNSNKDGAQVRQELYRAIEVDSRAYIAREWAAGRALRCGRGAYRVVKLYNNDGDFDMDLGIKRILNQGSVYFDPWATEPDWSDGEWCLITEDIPIARFKRLYPNSKISRGAVTDLSGVGNQYPGWIKDDSIRIAEYFRVVYTDQWLVFDPRTKKTDVLSAKPDPTTLPLQSKVRKVDKRTVEWYVISAVEVLDTEVWEGRYIPVVPVIGKEYNIDGKERVFKGMVSGAKDAQRMYNYFKSLQVESAHLTTEETYIGDIRAFEGFENHDNWKGVKIRPVNSEVNGVTIAIPQRTFKTPELEAITMALRELDGDIKATTGRHAASLGEYGPDRSGRAIREMKVQGETTTSGYMKNFAHISMTYEAKVILDMMRFVYDSERIVRLLGEQDKERTVMLNTDFYETPDGPVPATGPDGMPVPPPLKQPAAPAGFLRRAAGMIGLGAPPPPAEPYPLKRYDLNVEADYAFVVSIGRSYQTQREEDAAVFQTIIEANPAMAEVLGPLWIKSLEGPAASEAYELLRKINPQLRAATEEGAPEIPPEVQAQLQQAEEMIEQLSKELEAKTAQMALDAQRLEMEAAIKRMDIESRERLAAIESQGAQAELATKAQVDTEAARVRAEADAAARIEEARAKAEQDRQRLVLELAANERIEAARLAFERQKHADTLALEMRKLDVDVEKARLAASVRQASSSSESRPS